VHVRILVENSKIRREEEEEKEDKERR